MTLGSHQQSIGKSQNHITPKWLLDCLGEFELDPCAADPRPWSCARVNYTERDDGLSRPWHGRIFLNPPFDRFVVGRWIRKLGDHGRGIALLHARVETSWFQPVWKHASGILFLEKRIKFCRIDGTEQPFNSGAPPVLAAFGEKDLDHLRTCGIAGTLVTEWQRI
jgi:DNA N-6-adenine-methyltransferase (Dam)